MSLPLVDMDGPVAAAIIALRGRVLLIRRAAPEGDLIWQFPAGKIEPGESGEDAAVRETLEEVGLTVTAMGRLGERVHPSTGRLMVYVACEVLDGEAHVADDEELAAVAWLTPGELPEYVPCGFYGPVQDYLDEIFARD